MQRDVDQMIGDAVEQFFVLHAGCQHHRSLMTGNQRGRPVPPVCFRRAGGERACDPVNVGVEEGLDATAENVRQAGRLGSQQTAQADRIVIVQCIAVDRAEGL